MEQSNNASLREEKQKGRRPLLVLLLLLVLLTTSVVGFILGRSAGPEPLGQVIDTILLSPDDSAGTQPPGTFHLTGRVFYSDGTPAAGRALELHSDPLTAISDSEGGFLFANAPEGTHTIVVRGNDGSIASQREIEILRDSSAEAVHVDLREDGAYVIELAIDVRVLEIAIELDAETLYIDPERVTFSTREGLVVTEAGAASIHDGAVVSSGGNVYLSDGSIVLPGGAAEDPTYIIRPDDSVIADQAISADGAEVAADGTVTLPDGTQIRPGGQIVTPGRTEHDPGKGGVVVSGGVVTPIGGATSGKENTSSSGNTSSDGNAPPPSSSEGSSSSGSGNAASDSSVSADSSADDDHSSGGGSTGGGPAGSGSTSSDSSDEDPDPGSLSVYGESQNGGYVQWTQNSTIDLFFNRTSGMQEKIAPGSAGYYQFQLKNTRLSPLNISITLNENGLHLPLAFTLTPLDVDGNKLSEQAVSSVSTAGGLVLKTSIVGDGSVVYCLDWKWPFEGSDALDTQIGGGNNLAYRLSMTIHAEAA